MPGKHGCQQCGEIDSIVEDHNTGDTVCKKCGLIQMENTPADDPEWRTYMEEDNVDDYVRANTYVDKILPNETLSISTVRSSGSRSRNGAYTSFLPSEKRIISIYKLIDEMTEELHISKALARSSLHLYEEYSKAASNFKGAARVVVCAASLYIVCRKEHTFRLFVELSIASHHSIKEIAESFKHIAQTLHLTLPQPTDEDYLSRYCYILDQPPSVYKNSIKIIHAIKDLSLVSQNTLALHPTVVLFTSLLFESKPAVTLKDIVIFSAKTERVIKTLYTTLYKGKDDIVFNAFKTELAESVLDTKKLFSLLDKLPPSLTYA